MAQDWLTYQDPMSVPSNESVEQMVFPYMILLLCYLCKALKLLFIYQIFITLN